MSGQTYFITGTNRGIGLELVKQLLNDPSNHVIATLRHYDDIPELTVTKNLKLTILRLDYNSEEPQKQYDALKMELDALDLGIDVFIANAAKNDATTNVLDSDIDTFVNFFKINTLGPIETFKVIKPFMLKKETRKVIFTSSILGSIGGFPDFLSKHYPCAPYGLSKAGLNFLGRELSFELAHEGFIVVNYHPGLINTNKSSTGTAHSSSLETPNDDYSALKQNFKPDQTLLTYVVNNTFSVQEGVHRELKVIDGLTASDNGKFLSHNGKELEY